VSRCTLAPCRNMIVHPPFFFQRPVERPKQCGDLRFFFVDLEFPCGSLRDAPLSLQCRKNYRRFFWHYATGTNVTVSLTPFCHDLASQTTNSSLERFFPPPQNELMIALGLHRLLLCGKLSLLLFFLSTVEFPTCLLSRPREIWGLC